MDVPETLTIIFSSSGLRRSLAIGGGGKGLLAMGTHPMAAARAKGNQAATDAILPPLMLVSPLWGAILMAYAGRQVIVPVVLVTTSTTVASVTSWNFFFSFFSAMLLLNSIFYDFLCFFFNTEHAYTGHTHTALQIQQVANLPLPLPSPPLWLLQQELATLQLSLVWFIYPFIIHRWWNPFLLFRPVRPASATGNGCVSYWQFPPLALRSMYID